MREVVLTLPLPAGIIAKSSFQFKFDSGIFTINIGLLLENCMQIIKFVMPWVLDYNQFVSIFDTINVEYSAST